MEYTNIPCKFVYCAICKECYRQQQLLCLYIGCTQNPGTRVSQHKTAIKAKITQGKHHTSLQTHMALYHADTIYVNGELSAPISHFVSFEFLQIVPFVHTGDFNTCEPCQAEHNWIEFFSNSDDENVFCMNIAGVSCQPVYTHTQQQIHFNEHNNNNNNINNFINNNNDDDDDDDYQEQLHFNIQHHNNNLNNKNNDYDDDDKDDEVDDNDNNGLGDENTPRCIEEISAYGPGNNIVRGMEHLTKSEEDDIINLLLRGDCDDTDLEMNGDKDEYTPRCVNPSKLKNIESPSDHDVVGGRSGASSKHQGNVTYRSLVTLNKPLYTFSEKLEKIDISRSIVAAIRAQDPPGRFLKLDPSTGLWNDIGDKKAIEKTSQALREGQPKLRKYLYNLKGGSGGGKKKASGPGNNDIMVWGEEHHTKSGEKDIINSLLCGDCDDTDLEMNEDKDEYTPRYIEEMLAYGPGNNIVRGMEHLTKSEEEDIINSLLRGDCDYTDLEMNEDKNHYDDDNKNNDESNVDRFDDENATTKFLMKLQLSEKQKETLKKIIKHKSSTRKRMKNSQYHFFENKGHVISMLEIYSMAKIFGTVVEKTSDGRLEETDLVNHHDVFLHLGKRNHIGNINYDKFIDTHRQKYKDTNKNDEKNFIAKKILDYVHSLDPPGRFLEMIDENNNTWMVAEKSEAMKKVKQSLGKKIDLNNSWKVFEESEALKKEKKEKRLILEVLLEDGTKVQQNDVLLGRGIGSINHNGNIIYRNLISTRSKEHYCTKDIAKEIVYYVHNLDPPGRFLEMIDNSWMVVEEKKALEKVKQALGQEKESLILLEVLLEDGTKVQQNDVLLGRGSGSNDYVGNINFRNFINKRRTEYNGTRKTVEKRRIAKEILDNIHSLNPPGRFLEMIDNSWKVVEEKKALEKMKQALRQRRVWLL